MTMTLQEFDQRMVETLVLPELAQYVAADGLHNGLQTWGDEEITTVGFAVSANLATFQLAKEQGCQALVVHHGMKWEGTTLPRLTYERFAFLIKNDLSLWSAHFLLDAHPDLGNAAQVLHAAGAQPVEPYMTQGAPWGRIGQMTSPTQLEDIVKQLQPHLSPRTTVFDLGPKQVKRIACVTGRGAPDEQELLWLKDHNVDLFITGEVHEQNRNLFQEVGISLIAGGHYHTETFGVQALQKVVEQEWQLKTVWLDHPNDI